MLRITVLVLALFLAACGGGDPEDNPLPDDAQKTIPAPNCKADPKLCS